MVRSITVLVCVLLSLNGSAAARDDSFKLLDPFQDCEACPAVMPLPPGRFLMGADDQRDAYGPAVDRSVPRSFAIGVTEVTFDQYESCVKDGVCTGNKSDHGWGRGTQPVINVSWYDAVAYAQWLSEKTGALYRLPTEVEWEYAARAGTVTRYPWGESVGEGNANCRRCSTPWSGIGAAPTAQFPPNGFGLYDMNGNVSEWVADCWSDRHAPDTESTASERRALKMSDTDKECPARVTRGGDWYYVPILATSAARKSNASNLWSYTIGFRVVRELE